MVCGTRRLLRLCLGGPAPMENQARKVLGPHAAPGGRCSCPLPPQEQGRAVAASRSLPQLPSVLFIEQVLAWWPLFNSKAFKRGTNREILPLAWRTATVLMDFFKTTLGLGASPSPSAFAVCIRAGTVAP